MTDSLERLLKDLSFDLPADLVERAKAGAGIDRVERVTPAQPTDSLGGEDLTIRRITRGRTTSMLNREAKPPRALALIAALLAIAVVATFVFTRLMRTTNEVPANKSQLAQAGGFVVQSFFFSASDAAVLETTPNHAASGKLVITHDGGQTWIPTSINAGVVGVTWLDSRHLVVAADNIGRPSELLMTADGGHNWRTIGPRLGSSEAIISAYFLDPLEGWTTSCRDCASSQGPPSPEWTVWHTVDAGAHWQQLGNRLSWPSVVPLGLEFVDSLHGFMGAASTDGTGRLIVTLDGGSTWRLVDLPQPPGGWSQPDAGPTICAAGFCTLLPHIFGKQGVVLVQGTLVSGDWAYTTADMGLTWSDPHVVPAQIVQPAEMPWQAPLDPENWWMTDPQGTLYRTNDGGSTWHSSRPTLPASYSLESVSPVGADILWGIAIASGDHTGDHFVVRSSDGGATWSAINLPGR
jgi:photosystem II stability/assembly factor-like uncharacterized protein